MSDIDTIRQTLKAIVGKSYNLITQGESVSQLRQPSARAIYDLARDAQPILSRVEQELAAAKQPVPDAVYAPSREAAQKALDDSYLAKYIAVPVEEHERREQELAAAREALDAARRYLKTGSMTAEMDLLAAVSQTDQIREDDPSEVHPPDSRAESQAGLNGPSGSPTSSSRRVLEWIADPSYVGNYDDATVVAIYRGWAHHALAAVPQEEGER